MFNRFHQLRAAVGATFVNLRQEFPTPLINLHNFINDQPEEDKICLVLYVDVQPSSAHGCFITQEIIYTSSEYAFCTLST